MWFWSFTDKKTKPSALPCRWCGETIQPQETFSHIQGDEGQNLFGICTLLFKYGFTPPNRVPYTHITANTVLHKGN